MPLTKAELDEIEKKWVYHLGIPAHEAGWRHTIHKLTDEVRRLRAGLKRIKYQKSFSCICWGYIREGHMEDCAYQLARQLLEGETK